MRLLIGKLKDIVIGMSCTIETYVGKYCASSLIPLSTNSLCYGSNTMGVHITKRDEKALDYIRTIANQLNLKTHVVSEIGTNRLVEIAIPYHAQLHRFETEDQNGLYFLHMCHRLWTKYTSDISLRLEVMSTYNNGEVEQGYQYFTWKTPCKCSECGKFINDYDYYSFEKYSFNDKKSLLFQYLCCLSCYAKLLPSRNFKVPFNRIVRKALSAANKLTHWVNEATNEIIYTKPCKRIPLNPDAFDSLNDQDVNHARDKSNLTTLFSQLRTEFIDNLIEELNNSQDAMLIDAEHLAKIAHSKGINIRLIGRLSYQASYNYVREIAVILIISRGIKHLILDALNRLDISEDPRDIITSYLNHLLCVVETNTSKLLWDQLSEYV